MMCVLSICAEAQVILTGDYKGQELETLKWDQSIPALTTQDRVDLNSRTKP